MTARVAPLPATAAPSRAPKLPRGALPRLKPGLGEPRPHLAQDAVVGVSRRLGRRLVHVGGGLAGLLVQPARGLLGLVEQRLLPAARHRTPPGSPAPPCPGLACRAALGAGRGVVARGGERRTRG